jgi:hypothetical protein
MFLRFYIEFTSCSYNTHRSEVSFCERPPGTFQKITDRPLVCTKLPRTTWGFAMWSKGLEGGAVRRILARPPARLAGEVGENDQELTTGLLVVDLGSERLRRGGTTKTGGGRRWKFHSGELAARAGQQASVEALWVQEEGRSGTCCRCKRPEGGAL